MERSVRMIKSYTITTDRGKSIKLEMTRPEKSGFIISNVEGLGPVKSNINTIKSATSHGTRYNSASLDQRNIVMSFIFCETKTESIEDIRHKSYEYFPINERIDIVVETDKRTLKTEGWVETNEPNIYSSQEGCTVSILCPDPFFYSMTVNRTTFSGIEPNFEFPFENESLTEPLLTMSTLKSDIVKNIEYDGDFNTPVTITIRAVDSASNVVIYNMKTHEQFQINTDKLAVLTGSEIIAGDTIIINTKQGSRSAVLIRDGVQINIFNCINRDADWFMLSKGVNTFAYKAESGESGLYFSIENKVVYTGV